MTPTRYLRGIRWALRIDYVGAAYWWTSDGDPLTVDGVAVGVLGGLDVEDLTESLPVAGEVADRRSMSVALQWPTDHAAEAGRGLDLTTATGTLYLLAVGDVADDGRVVVSGPLSRPEYGGTGEPIRLTIGGEPYEDAAQLLEADAQITTQTWPDAPEQSLGRYYPLVWGRPGVVDDAGVVEGSPAYSIEDGGSGSAVYLLIAGHPVAASTVQIVYDDGAGTLTAESANVTTSTDGLGRRVSICDVSGLSADLRAAGAWSVRWSSGHSLQSPYRAGGVVSSLGEIGRYLADQSTVPQDRAAWAAVAQRYPWASSGWVSEPASPYAVLRDQILPALPVALTWGRRGMRPVPYAYDSGPADIVDHLRAGEDCARVDGVSYEREPRDIAQEIRIGYGGDASRRWWVLRASGRVAASDSSGVWSRAAAQRWRSSSTRTREVVSPAIWRRSAAAQVGLWISRVHGASPRIVEYDVGVDRAWIDLGAVVLLTDAELSEADTVCIVVRRRIGAGVRLGLLILPTWDTRQRARPAGADDDLPVYPRG